MKEICSQKAAEPPEDDGLTGDEWLTVASEVYGLTSPMLSEVRDHHSRHFFLGAEEGRYVLSRSRVQPDRMAKSYQFDLIRTLRSNGFRRASLPVRTKIGSYCHLRRSSWWVLKRYTGCDSSASSSTPAAVAEAARVLAELHRCGSGFPERLSQESDRDDLGAYYLPLIRWPDWSEDIASGFHWHELDGSNSSFVRSQLELVQRETADIRSWCAAACALSITHQDYRPANLCFADETVREVWDFDMAVIDCCVSDVAFAALQFGGRECLFPDASLELAGRFIREYIAASGIMDLQRESKILRWFFAVTILRRLLLNYHAAERIELLRLVLDADWRL